LITYFDTSALVKTLIAEPGSEAALDIWNASDVRATSMITYAEARAALAAARRDRRLIARSHAKARSQLDERWDELALAAVSDEVVRLAGDMADRQGLRGYDAVHLATAMLVGEGDQVMFATWDGSLTLAVRRAGLSTIRLGSS
jgi:predicted nucleic acid-binding protein